MNIPTKFFLDGPIYKAMVEFAEAFGEDTKDAHALAGEIEQLIGSHCASELRAMLAGFQDEVDTSLKRIAELEGDDT